jgi:glucan biosynthesis protein C
MKDFSLSSQTEQSIPQLNVSRPHSVDPGLDAQQVESTQQSAGDGAGARGTPAPPAKSSRLFFVDHLRAFLIIFVIMHHLAVTYGASGVFYYKEPLRNDPLASLVLNVFVTLNQAYFMGFFFLISAYFTPGSFDQKGSASFLKDRLLRLGVPLVVFLLVLGPIAAIGIYYWTTITTPLIWLYPGLLILGYAVGPLWFIEILLIFDFGYVAWRRATRTHALPAKRAVKPPTYLAVGIFALALALASYLLRIVVPVGMFIPFLGFPSPAYLPQYLSFFILGVIAFRRDWFRTIPNAMGKVGFGVALVATILLLPLVLGNGGITQESAGKGYWQSAVFALWDSTFAVGMCLGLLTFFRRFFNGSGRFSRFLSQHAFTVYIIHPPILVLLALALRGIHPEQLLKYGLAVLISVPLCFALAYLVRKLPFASRIL